MVVQRRLADDAEATRTRAPLISTTTPKRADAVVDVALPGNLQAILETGIFARTDGYLRARYVDIGDAVKTGQLLAEIMLDGKATTLDARPLRASRFAENDLNPFTGLL